MFFIVGDVTKGELGFAAIPGKEKEFRDSIQLTVEYAKALGAKKLVSGIMYFFIVFTLML